MGIETREGILKINLKGTEIKTEERKGWLARIFKGKTIEVAQEAVTQMQYLEGIYNACTELGYKNVLSLDVNGVTVYIDEENKDDDFSEAVKLALEEVETEAYHIHIELDTTGDEEANIEIDMYGQHKDGEIPLNVSTIMENTYDDMVVLLEGIKTKINEKFGVESGEIEVDEDEPEEAKEEATEDEPEEAKEEATEDEPEEAKEEEEPKAE